MKLTPLDIHHKEFGHSLRGYNEEQVDRFLDEVADELERLFKENIDLSERLEAAQARLSEFEMQRHTINNTLVAAQRSADEITARAQAEADSVMRDAEMKAKDIIHAALSKKQVVASELARIKAAEEDFRVRYRALLEGNLRTISETALPDDIDLLLGETDEGIVASEVEVRPVARPVATFAPVAAQPEPEPTEVAQPTQAMPPVGQPTVTQAVTLGEVEGPELDPEIAFVDPGEFSLPSFSALGEREDDVDIEEID